MSTPGDDNSEPLGNDPAPPRSRETAVPGNRVIFPPGSGPEAVTILPRMSASRPQHRLDLATALWRSAWTAIFAMHLWPLAKVSLTLAASPGDWERWGSWSALLLATIFFAAKMLGARALKVSSPLAGAVLFLVAAGLVHGDRLMGDENAAAAAAIVTTTGVIAAVRYRHRLAERFTGLGHGCGRILWQLALHLREPQRCISSICFLVFLSLRPRGPPLARI
jgi:hypothetical protein